MDTAVKEEVVEEVVHQALTVADRCDAANCGAQARARVITPSGNSILFCRHHAEKNRESMEAQGCTLITEYEGL